MIRKFLQPDPSTRLTIQDALQDEYFKETNIEMMNLGKQFLSPSLVKRLKLFKINSTFQREIIKLMVQICNDSEEVSALKNVFFYIDYLNNGRLTKYELLQFFKEQESEVTEKELEEIIQNL